MTTLDDLHDDFTQRCEFVFKAEVLTDEDIDDPEELAFMSQDLGHDKAEFGVLVGNKLGNAIEITLDSSGDGRGVVATVRTFRHGKPVPATAISLSDDLIVAVSD